jgi:hypothetical protein
MAHSLFPGNRQCRTILKELILRAGLGHQAKALQLFSATTSSGYQRAVVPHQTRDFERPQLNLEQSFTLIDSTSI